MNEGSPLPHTETVNPEVQKVSDAAASDITNWTSRMSLTQDQQSVVDLIIVQARQLAIQDLGLPKPQEPTVKPPIEDAVTIKPTLLENPPIEVPSTAPYPRSEDGDLWIQGEIGSGSTSTVSEAIFREKDGTVHKAVVKKTKLEGIQKSHPEQIVAEAEILKLGIPGLPKYFTSGFENYGRLVSNVQDRTDSDSQPSLLAYPLEITVVMERLSMQQDQWNSYRILYDKDPSTLYKLLGTELHTEAVALASFYYYLYVASRLNKNGWSFPDFDFKISKHDSIIYDDNEGVFHACDLGMAQPLTQENAALLVNRLGGSGVFDLMRIKNIRDEMYAYKTPDGRDTYSLEKKLSDGIRDMDLPDYEWKVDCRSTFLWQILQAIGSYRSGNTPLEDMLKALDEVDKPARKRLFKILRYAFSNPDSDKGWSGLERAFMSSLSALGDEEHIGKLYMEVNKIMARTLSS